MTILTTINKERVETFQRLMRASSNFNTKRYAHKRAFLFLHFYPKKFNGALFGFRGSEGLPIGGENERCAREMDESKRTIHPMKQGNLSPTNHLKKVFSSVFKPFQMVCSILLSVLRYKD